MKFYVFLFLSVCAFSLLGSVTIYSPNGSEYVQRGMQLQIYWDDDIPENVKIELFQNDAYHSDIVSSTPSEGIFDWNVPNNIMGDYFTVKISSILDPDNEYDFSDYYFSISGGMIDLMFPNGGETFSRGELMRIHWYKDFSEKVKIELYQNNAYLATICDSTEYDEYDWFIPFDFYGENYQVKVSSVIFPDLLYDTSMGYFNVSRGMIALNYPYGGELFENMGQMSIFWTDDIIEKVKIELYQDDIYYATVCDSTESDGEYIWDIPGDISGNFKMKITSIYDEGVFTINDYTFEIIKLQITILTPNGGEQLARYTPFDIIWTDNINEDVKIQIYKDDELYFYLADTESDGSFTWSPDVFAGNFKIKITSLLNDSIYDFSDATFEILKGNISVNSPAGGETIEMLQDFTVLWTKDFLETVNISLYKSSDLITSFNNYSNDSCLCSIYSDNLIAGNDYKIRVTSEYFSDLFDESGYFTVKGTNNVKGSLSGIWTEPNSPYILTDSAYIELPNLLSIEPGVKVKPVETFKNFDIFGKITATGESDNKVRFEDITLRINNSSSTDSSKITNSIFLKSDRNDLLPYNKTFGAGSDDAGFSVRQTSDGGYIVVGHTTYGAGGRDVFLIKTDSKFNKLWDKTFGDSNDQYGKSVKQLADGGYIITGYSEPYGTIISDLLLIRTDSNGNQIWYKTFGGTSYERGTDVEVTNDGNFIVTGYTRSYGSGGNDVWLLKIDTAGNKLWDRTYGGSSGDEGNSLKQTIDGGFIIAGVTGSYGAGGRDLWLIKTDSAGNLTWSKTFGGTNTDVGYSVIQTADGNFVVTGHKDYDVWLIKTDTSGTKIWDKSLIRSTTVDNAYSVQQTLDGGYIMTGSTNVDFPDNYYTTNIWLIKADSDGNYVWNRIFERQCWSVGRSVIQNNDGCYTLTGEISDPLSGNLDAFLIKTDGYGNDIFSQIEINNNSKIVINNSIFQGNTNGYSLITNNASPVISNCLFTGNKGGIKFIDSSPQFVINNTIADNDSIGLFFEGNSDPRMMNNIVYGNGSHEVFIQSDDSDPVFRYNDIEGGQAGFWLDAGVTYTGLYESNLNTDPLFITGTFMLQETSPCKDTGYPNLTNETLGTLYIPLTDITDSLRLCGRIDMGCYEYYYIVTTPDSPANVRISVSADSLTIDWDVAANANSYHIYRSDDPYGTFEYQATVATNKWNTIIDSGTKKFYYIISSSETIKNIKPVKPLVKKIKMNYTN